MPYKVLTNNGTDWSLGTPSYIYPRPSASTTPGSTPTARASIYTCNVPNNVLTLGKFDLKTGAFKPLKVTAANGLAAPAHDAMHFGDPSGNHLCSSRQPQQGRASASSDTKTDRDRSVHATGRHGADRGRYPRSTMTAADMILGVVADRRPCASASGG